MTEEAKEEAGGPQVGLQGAAGEEGGAAAGRAEGRGGAGAPQVGLRGAAGLQARREAAGEAAGEAGGGLAGGAPRRGGAAGAARGLAGQASQAGSWASGRAPPPSALRVACPPRSTETAPLPAAAAQQPPSSSDWGEASTRGWDVGS